jgi:alkylation response protein AidB-like acyl-CoA dehydrogenase
MDFSFTAEQEELRRYAAQWLGQHSATGDVRTLMATPDGYDSARWAGMAEMGWQAMAISEEYGGAGFGFLELFVLLEEQGRTLLCAPFFSTVVMAATALAEGTEEQRAEWLPRIAAGEIVATVAHAEPGGGWMPEDVRFEAVAGDDGWTLTGVKSFVLDGSVADLFVVAARTPDGVELILVPAGADGLTVRSLDVMDQTRKQAEITFEAVRVPRGALLGGPGQGEAILLRVLERAAVALAAEQVGGAQRCLDMAVDYAKDRRQFGRPIGSFQAIKHKCADMRVRVEAARAAAYYAAWALATDSEERALVVPVAKAYCSQAFYQCAAETIQIHGGIGFTWEHDAHLYFKRAKSSELMFGDPTSHRRRLADMLF